MDTHQLEYIIAIAEEGSLSRAAERLFVSQSALSQYLAKLQKEGLPPLFSRSGGEMHLTDAGKVYVNGARTMLQLAREAEGNLQCIGTEQLSLFRIAVDPSLQQLFYLNVYPWLRREYPRVEIRVQTIGFGLVRRALTEDEIDLAFFYGSTPINALIPYTIISKEALFLFHTPGENAYRLPLALPEQGTHLRALADRALALQKKPRQVYAEPRDVYTALEMALTGECAVPAPGWMMHGSRLTAEQLDTPFRFYTLAAHRPGPQPAIITHTEDKMQAVLSHLYRLF